MTRKETPPARVRNALATRAAILDAARVRFAGEGYDGAGLRDIAADARVDVALVSRYFGSKDELFQAVLSSCGAPEEILAGPVSDFGRRVAHMLVIEPMDSSKLDKLLIMLRSASSPKAGAVIRRMSLEEFYGPFEEMIGGEQASVQARLAGSIIMGFALSRAIDDAYLLPQDARQALCDRLAITLQNAVSR